MKIIYKYNENYSKELENKLNKLKIKFKRVTIDRIMDKITFKMVKGSLLEKEIISLLNSEPLIFVEYNNKELNDADFLRIVPTSQKVKIINKEECFGSLCQIEDQFGIIRTYHEEQMGKIKIKNVPKGSSLYSPDTGFSHIFADSNFYNMVKKNDIKGIKFNSVGTKTTETCKGFYQLLTDNIIKFDDVKLEIGMNVKIENCSICKKKRIVPIDETYQLSLKIKKSDLTEDFYATEDVFGEGIPERYYIISQKLYKLIRKEKLDKNIRFVPIILNWVGCIS